MYTVFRRSRREMGLLVDGRKFVDRLVQDGARHVAVVLDSPVGPRHERGIERRVSLVSVPGSFVNLLDTIGIDPVSEPEQNNR